MPEREVQLLAVKLVENSRAKECPVREEKVSCGELRSNWELVIRKLAQRKLVSTRELLARFTSGKSDAALSRLVKVISTVLVARRTWLAEAVALLASEPKFQTTLPGETA